MGISFEIRVRDFQGVPPTLQVSAASASLSPHRRRILEECTTPERETSSQRKHSGVVAPRSSSSAVMARDR